MGSKGYESWGDRPAMAGSLSPPTSLTPALSPGEWGDYLTFLPTRLPTVLWGGLCGGRYPPSSLCLPVTLWSGFCGSGMGWNTHSSSHVSPLGYGVGCVGETSIILTMSPHDFVEWVVGDWGGEKRPSSSPILQYMGSYYNRRNYITIHGIILQYKKLYYNTRNYITIPGILLHESVLQYNYLYCNT